MLNADKNPEGTPMDVFDAEVVLARYRSAPLVRLLGGAQP
jgi:hypothetical protein